MGYKTAEMKIEVGEGPGPTKVLVPLFPRIPSTSTPDTAALNPEDLVRYPRASFGFRLSADRGSVVDTFKGIATKDLVVGPDTTISLAFSQEELDRVYHKALQIRLFEWPGSSPRIVSSMSIEPNFRTYLTVRAGNVEKNFDWMSDGVPASTDVIRWNDLRALGTLINSIVKNRAEYQALPKARGVYL